MIKPSWSMIESLLNTNHNELSISEGLFKPFELSVDALSGRYGVLYATPEIPASKLSETLKENLNEIRLSDSIERFVAAYEAYTPSTSVRLGYAARDDDRTFYMNKLSPSMLFDFLTDNGMEDFAERIKKPCLSFGINSSPSYLGMSFGYAGLKKGKHKAYMVLPECSSQSLYDYLAVSGGEEWAQTLIGASRLIYGNCQFYKGGRVTLTVSDSSPKPGVSYYLGDHVSDSVKIILCFALCSLLKLPLTYITAFVTEFAQIFDWKYTKQLSYFSIEPHGTSGARLRLWLRSEDAK